MSDSSARRTIAFWLLLTTVTGLLLAAAPVGRSLSQGEQHAETVSGDGDYGILISDGLFLYASSVLDLDVQSFLESQPGPLAGYVEQIDGDPWPAADSIQYNAMRYGVNPQLLVTLLEARTQALSDAGAAVPLLDQSQSTPSIRATFHGYVKQLAEGLLLAYDGHRHGSASKMVVFPSGEKVVLPEAPNAGTYAIQATLTQTMSRQDWESWVQGPGPQFVDRFEQWFGNPLREADQDLMEATAGPTGTILPFPIGETWYYTGGPHNYAGGTPGCTYGVYCPRPWSAIDLAPPEVSSCPGSYYPANRWIVAARRGTVIQSSQALIVIDHGDGWRTYYSHVSSADRRGTGPVERGDLLGHPSCEVEPGGFTTGVHVHFALFQSGVGFVNIAGASLSGWLVSESSHYNGFMSLGGALRQASTGRHNGLNDVFNGGVSGSCPISGGVLLYKHVNFDCDGGGSGTGYFLQSEAGLYDLPASFDDQASSIRVPPGRSARLYELPGRRGASVCLSGDDPNFTDNFFDDGATPLNDRVSSIDIFDADDCTGPYEGGSWDVEYFGDTELTSLCGGPTSLDEVYIFSNWAGGAPAEGCPADQWSARFTRNAYFPGGAYIFDLTADEQARLKVDGEPVFDNWSGPDQTPVTRNLPAGLHEVVVEYADSTGPAYLSAWWRGPGFESLPHESQQPAQWYARYWANQGLSGEPVVSVNEGNGPLLRDWGVDGPGYDLPADHFSTRIERQVPMGCGTYRFQIHTDDGVRFWIDDQLVLDAWFDQVGDHEVVAFLDFGNHHFKLEHYENGGLANLSLAWSRDAFCSPSGSFFLPFVGRD